MSDPIPRNALENVPDVPVQVEYRHLNPACAYCGKEPTVVRVTTTTHGQMLVSTLCKADAHGEIAHSLNIGFQLMGDDREGAVFNASLINMEVAEQMGNAIAEAAMSADEDPSQ